MNESLYNYTHLIVNGRAYCFLCINWLHFFSYLPNLLLIPSSWNECPLRWWTHFPFEWLTASHCIGKIRSFMPVLLNQVEMSEYTAIHNSFQGAIFWFWIEQFLAEGGSHISWAPYHLDFCCWPSFQKTEMMLLDTCIVLDQIPILTLP